MRNIFKTSILVLIIAICFHSCDRDRNHPGQSYWPDMMDSKACETYSENPNFLHGQSARPPVKGSIPREMVPFGFIKTDDDRLWAGQTLHFPRHLFAKDVVRGQQLYKIYCQNCHDEKGLGKGFLFSSGKYPYPPASIVSTKMKEAPEGEIFHVISVGWGVMGAHGPQLTPQERWLLSGYVKVILQNEGSPYPSK